MTDGGSSTARPAALIWGVKESFRAYVTASGGTVDVTEPAQLDPAGFRFPLAESSVGDVFWAEGKLPARGELRYTGEVRFQAHGGMLVVVIIDPSVVFEPGEATLTVVDTDYLPDRSKRLKMALLDTEAIRIEPGSTGIEAPAALTEEGSRLLGDVYPAQTALDPLIIETPQQVRTR
jgi:hypothetical protein